MLATHSDLVAWDIALWLDNFIVGLLLKFLGIVEVLLAHAISSWSSKDSFSAGLNFERRLKSYLQEMQKLYLQLSLKNIWSLLIFLALLKANSAIEKSYV